MHAVRIWNRGSPKSTPLSDFVAVSRHPHFAQLQSGARARRDEDSFSRGTPMLRVIRCTKSTRPVRNDWRRSGSAQATDSRDAQRTLDCIGDAVVTTDLAGCVTYLNGVAERLTGWSEAEALGMPLDVVMPLVREGERDPIENCALRCLAEGRAVDLEDGVVLRRRDGTEVPVGDSAAPIRTPDGRTTGVVLVFRDESEKRRIGQRLLHEASHDQLTGLLNRREFERRLERAIRGASENDNQHAVVFMDLDRFKQVNDTCGHGVGDALLKNLAPRLRNCLRSGDSLARIGGDEFGAILPDCSGTEAAQIAELIRVTVAEYRFLCAGNSLSVGVSVGVVEVGRQSNDVADVLNAADIACYRAKAAGGNQVYATPTTAVATQWHFAPL